MALTRVGVVVVTYRSASTVAATLTALPVGELGAVVVVDNASDDATSDVVRAFGGVQLIEAPTNLGFGAGNNVGLSHLPPHVELVLFLNPDATIDAPNLQRLAAYLDANPSAAIVGPRLYRGDEPITGAGREATVLTELRVVAPAPLARLVRPRRHEPAFAVAGPVGYVEGACFLARRSALAAIGGFDERFFLFYEELDLARRLRAGGWTVDFEPHARAHHAVAQSRATTAGGAHPILLRSATLYLRKWHGPLAAAAFRVTARATSTARRWRRARPRSTRGPHAG